jgi:hypothetical protein
MRGIVSIDGHKAFVRGAALAARIIRRHRNVGRRDAGLVRVDRIQLIAALWITARWVPIRFST